MASRSVAFKIGLMIKLVYVPCIRAPFGADNQTNVIPYYVTPYLEAVWPTLSTICKLLHACSTVECFLIMLIVVKGMLMSIEAFKPLSIANKGSVTAL